MLYREAGQYKTSYAADMATFPLREDRIGVVLILAAAFTAPWWASEFLLQAFLLPFLILSLAALGLNLLVGYTGLISLGTGAFMGVGAYAAAKLAGTFPWLDPVTCVLLSGLASAAIGTVFGLPSLRIKGFYLAVATLAAQFFLQWCFIRIPWLYDYNVSGAIEVPQRELFGLPLTGANATPAARYLTVLSLVVVLTWGLSNLVRGHLGRRFMAVRDMDIAAELMGIDLPRTKLLAFAVSSYVVGVAGACLVFFYLGSAEAEAWNINQSFLVLFMVIIGGLGSLLGSFLGAALIFGLPIVLRALPLGIEAATVEHLTFLITGALIIAFLILEPHGLARLWQVAKQKLRVWPFPY